MSASAIYGVPELNSSIDKQQSASYAMENVKSGNLPAFPLAAGNDSGKFYFGVRIVNGSQAESGTRDIGVNIVLVGTKGCTEKLYLPGGTYDGIASKSKYQDVVIATGDLGDVQVFIYGKKKKIVFDHDWYVDFSMVYPLGSGGIGIEFPCYHWIGNGETVSTAAATTTLSDITSSVLRKQRTKQLADRKRQYIWQQFPDTGLPSGIDDQRSDIPTDEQFEKVKNTDFTSNLFTAAVAMGFDLANVTLDSLDDFVDLANNLDMNHTPLYKDSRWATDVEFGRQILNGVNPIVIKKCTEIPSKFPVTDQMLQPFLTRGKTLQQEMADGRIYICDMEIMDGLPPKSGYYAPAPICLLYVNSLDQLVPIAIQIKQGLREEEQREPNPIFLPDEGIDWTIAKIYYRAADSQFHQIYTHYLSCHAMMETYAMGVMRNLPDAHPINKLLRPHFRYTMAINSRARSTLINDGGSVDKIIGIGGAGKNILMQRASEMYSVLAADIKKDTKQRKVNNASELPGYHFRDDGYLVWDATEKYARSVINRFYSSDDAVKDDTELQNFANDIYTNGFPSFYNGKQGHDFPQTIETKDSLIEHCTRILFNGASRHSAVNFGQYHIYSFVPNAPFCVRCAPPTTKGAADDQKLLDVLPDKSSAVLAIILTYTLSQYSPDEILLGNFPSERFAETEIQGFIQTYQADLAEIDSKIEQRNLTLDMPYPFMQPKASPNSITI